jgi:hypothetical protein
MPRRPLVVLARKSARFDERRSPASSMTMGSLEEPEGKTSHA